MQILVTIYLTILNIINRTYKNQVLTLYETFFIGFSTIIWHELKKDIYYIYVLLG